MGALPTLRLGMAGFLDFNESDFGEISSQVTRPFQHHRWGSQQCGCVVSPATLEMISLSMAPAPMDFPPHFARFQGHLVRAKKKKEEMVLGSIVLSLQKKSSEIPRKKQQVPFSMVFGDQTETKQVWVGENLRHCRRWMPCKVGRWERCWNIPCSILGWDNALPIGQSNKTPVSLWVRNADLRLKKKTKLLSWRNAPLAWLLSVCPAHF